MSDWERLFNAYRHLPRRTLRRLGIKDRHFWYEDLLQEGYIGLIRAARWYEVNRNDYGATFRSVAIMVIRRRIEDAMSKLCRARTITMGRRDRMDIQQYDTTMRMELVRDVVALMDKLTDRERAYVISHYVDEVTVTSISNATGDSRYHVTQEIKCGIDKIRDSFDIAIDDI